MEPYGLEAITAFERLAYLKTDTVAGGQSSYARDGLNFDWISASQPSFLGHDDNGDTLLNLEGAGVVYRIWCTGFKQPSPGKAANKKRALIKIYIDSNLTWEGALQDLFSGNIAPFVAPLVGTCPNPNSHDPKHDGFYCYLPIPFQSSIRIVVADFLQNKESNFYYNIGYHKFAPQAQVRSWTGKEDSSAAVALWSKVGQDPNPKFMGHIPGQPSESQWASGNVSILPGHSTRLLDIEGPGSVTAIKLHFAGGPQFSPPDLSPDRVPPETLDNVWLRISWDGEADPSVNAPASMFFALGQLKFMAPSRSLAVGFDGDWLYAYFPMPFRQHARIEISNKNLFKIEEVSFEIHYTGFHDDFFKVGYFKTAFSHQSLDANTQPISFLQAEGAGHLVGVVESIQQRSFEQPLEGMAAFFGPGNGYCMLEGDERIYVDDCRTPIVQGTGTEDFFNSAWYFSETPFHREMHGCTFIALGENQQGRVSAHRLFLQDAIPFRKNIRAVIEHGPNRNDVAVFAWTLAYYYHQPTPRAVLCDTLFVGYPPSESAHQYLAGPGWHGTQTYTFEGDSDRIEVTQSGRAHKSQSSFVVTIPPDNQGLILRRMFDYSVGDQKALVLVDDRPVGNWFTAVAIHATVGAKMIF